MGLFDFLKGSGSNPLAHDGSSASSPTSAPVGTGVSHDFRLEVEDVFTITGRGTVVTGRIQSGSISAGADVLAERGDGSTTRLQVTGIEMFRKVTDHAQAGDNVGLLMRGGDAKALTRGDVLRAG